MKVSEILIMALFVIALILALVTFNSTPTLTVGVTPIEEVFVALFNGAVTFFIWCQIKADLRRPLPQRFTTTIIKRMVRM